MDCAHAAMLMRRLHSMLDSLLHSEVPCGHLRRGPDCLHPYDWLHDNLRERPRNHQPGWKPRILDDSRGVEVLRPQCVIPARCSCSEMLCWDIPFYPPSCKNPLASFWCSTSRGFSACFVLLSTKNRNTIPVVASRT